MKCVGFNLMVVGYSSKKTRHLLQVNCTDILKLVH